MRRGSGSGLSPCLAFPGLAAQPGPWVRVLGHRGSRAHPFPVPAAFPASSPHVASSLTAVSGAACPAPSIPACPTAGPRLGSPARRGSAGAHRPPRRGGARHFGLSGGSCEMSANILCGLLQQASRCRCWRASRNRSPAVTNGSGTAAAMPTRAPPAGWAMLQHSRLCRCTGTRRGNPGGQRCPRLRGWADPWHTVSAPAPHHRCNVSPQPY